MRSQIFLFLSSILILTSCNTTLSISDPKEDGTWWASKQAEYWTETDIDLDLYRKKLVVQEDLFTEGMARKIEYFNEVTTIAALEKEIIKANLQDKIGSLDGLIGLNKACKELEPFLYLKLDAEENDGKKYFTLKLNDPCSSDDLMVAARKVTSVVNDQTTFYPLFNSLVNYIKKNSKTYLRVLSKRKMKKDN